MKKFVRPAMAGFSTLAMLSAIAGAPAQKMSSKPVGYAATEKVLKARCVGCHQGAAPAAGVNLSSYEMVVKGKYKGKPLVVSKKPAASVLANALHGTGVQKMPPGGSLSPAETKTIEAWIAAGAKK